MTPRKYAQSSPLIQWAFLFEQYRPLQTSTCALFWRSVALTPLKLLGPIFFGGFFLFLAVGGLGNAYFPGLLPTWMRISAPPRPEPEANRVMWWVAWIVTTTTVVGIVGDWLGLWKWMHNFCYPVEIEGGLVMKGVCPMPNCPSRMVEEADGRWKCQRGHGYFVPILAANGDGNSPDGPIGLGESVIAGTGFEGSAGKPQAGCVQDVREDMTAGALPATSEHIDSPKEPVAPTDAPAPAAPPDSATYYQNALDLVADTLRDAPDETLLEKRDKLMAIVTNAVQWWRTNPLNRYGRPTP